MASKRASGVWDYFDRAEKRSFCRLCAEERCKQCAGKEAPCFLNTVHCTNAKSHLRAFHSDVVDVAALTHSKDKDQSGVGSENSGGSEGALTKAIEFIKGEGEAKLVRKRRHPMMPKLESQRRYMCIPGEYAPHSSSSFYEVGGQHLTNGGVGYEDALFEDESGGIGWTDAYEQQPLAGNGEEDGHEDVDLRLKLAKIAHLEAQTATERVRTKLLELEYQAKLRDAPKDQSN